MSKIKDIIRKKIFGYKSDSETFINHLRSLGMKIGERTIIYEPRKTIVDATRPWLIDIGDDVKITCGVTILTHGYDWSVLAGLNDTVLGSAGSVKIGNNVFIGMNSTILKGVTIGNNVIIGAGSLVNKDIPDNCVAAGNPCRVVMTIDEYYKKRVSVQESEAFEVYSKYVDVYGKEPPETVFSEFFWLFQKRDLPLCDEFRIQMSHHGRFDKTYENLLAEAPKYDGYAEFLNAMREKKNRSEGI